MQRIVPALSPGLMLAFLQPLLASEPAGLPPTSAPRQVLLEAVLLTVPTGVAIDFGPTSPGKSSGSETGAQRGSGLKSAGFGYSAGMGPNLDSLVSKLAQNPHVKILQRPTVLTEDGLKASIFVGETRPYLGPGGSAYSSAPSIKQVPSGVTLDITPQIKPEGLVLLDLHCKVDRIVKNVAVPNVGEVPVTSRSETQTQVLIRDRNVFLMGGLIMGDDNSKKTARTALRFPKDLPVASALPLRSEAAPTQELLLLLRPVLLASEKAAMPSPHARAQELSPNSGGNL